MQVKTNQVKELRTSHSNNATLKQEKSQWFFFYILRFWVPKLIYPWPWYMWNVLHSVYLRNIQCNLQIICGWSDSVYLYETMWYICIYTGGWVTSACCCLMSSFVFWCSSVWYATLEALWLGMLHDIIHKLAPIGRLKSFLDSQSCLLKLCFACHVGGLNLDMKDLCLFVLQSVSAGCFDADHQLGVSRLGTGCRCCKCNHGNIASSLAPQWCNLLFPAAWASVFSVDVTVAWWVMCAFPPTVSQRLLRFPGYLRHQGNQGKCCYQPRYAEKNLQKQWSGSSLLYGFSCEQFNQWLMLPPKMFKMLYLNILEAYRVKSSPL